MRVAKDGRDARATRPEDPRQEPARAVGGGLRTSKPRPPPGRIRRDPHHPPGPGDHRRLGGRPHMRHGGAWSLRVGHEGDPHGGAAEAAGGRSRSPRARTGQPMPSRSRPSGRGRPEARRARARKRPRPSPKRSLPRSPMPRPTPSPTAGARRRSPARLPKHQRRASRAYSGAGAKVGAWQEVEVDWIRSRSRSRWSRSRATAGGGACRGGARPEAKPLPWSVPRGRPARAGSRSSPSPSPALDVLDGERARTIHGRARRSRPRRTTGRSRDS